ncbi:MAG: hypothetical protein KGZ63_07725 [Clostridiales bacterium]|jgi:hypothetical protein|nr:hypothetical protein [Clostridiales bacterium]
MKKMLPLIVVAMSVLLLFAGMAGAVVLEEPLVLEEGMMGITAIMDEPVENIVGVGIEGEVVITAIDLEELEPIEPYLDNEVDPVAEELMSTTAIGIEGDGEVTATGIEAETTATGATANDYTKYLIIAGLGILGLAVFTTRRKKLQPVTAK